MIRLLQIQLFIYFAVFTIGCSTTMDSSELKKHTELLKVSLEPYVKKSDRTLLFYNYKSKKQLGIPHTKHVEIKDKEILKAYRKWQNTIKNHTPNAEGFIGWGLYGAIDPFVSRKYADEHWVLLKTKVPANSRILDIRHHSDSCFPLKPELYNSLTAKCPEIKNISKYCPKKNKLAVFVNKLELTYDKYCYSLFIKTLNELDIDLIAYTWRTVSNEINGCDNKIQKANPAFIAYNLKLTSENSDLFEADIGENPNDDKIKKYKELYHSILNSNSSKSIKNHKHNFFTKKTEGYLSSYFLSKADLQVHIQKDLDKAYNCLKKNKGDNAPVPQKSHINH